LLEHCVRDELNRTATRRMAVFDPLKVVIDNLPADAPASSRSRTTPRTRPLECAPCPSDGRS
jgi:glutaminyl-tRNA synthetase